jgi:uncharacterized protein (TIGR02996 family)
MLDERTFLQVIGNDPDDDGPRLQYADWLDEKGDPASVARAEFIRVQCALESMRADDPARTTLRSREMELLEANWRTWIRPACQALGEPLPVGSGRAERYALRTLNPSHRQSHFIEQPWSDGGDVPYFHSCQFRRGFVAHAALFGKPYRGPAHLARLWERMPLDGLTLANFQPDEVQAALAAIDVTRLRSIELSFTSITSVELIMNMQTRKLNDLVVRGIHALSDTDLSFLRRPALDTLRTLVLDQFPIGDDGLEVIASAQFAKGLEHLVIDHCGETTEFVIGLDQNPDRFPALRHLGISRAFNPAALTVLSKRFGSGVHANVRDLPFPWRYYQ